MFKLVESKPEATLFMRGHGMPECETFSPHRGSNAFFGTNECAMYSSTWWSQLRPHSCRRLYMYYSRWRSQLRPHLCHRLYMCGASCNGRVIVARCALAMPPPPPNLNSCVRELWLVISAIQNAHSPRPILELFIPRASVHIHTHIHTHTHHERAERKNISNVRNLEVFALLSCACVRNLAHSSGHEQFKNCNTRQTCTLRILERETSMKLIAHRTQTYISRFVHFSFRVGRRSRSSSRKG